MLHPMMLIYETFKCVDHEVIEITSAANGVGLTSTKILPADVAAYPKSRTRKYAWVQIQNQTIWFRIDPSAASVVAADGNANSGIKKVVGEEFMLRGPDDMKAFRARAASTSGYAVVHYFE